MNGIFGPVRSVFKDLNDMPIWCRWAMLIIRDGGPLRLAGGLVAEMRGLGIIHQDCLGYATPPGKAWKEILLA